MRHAIGMEGQDSHDRLPVVQVKGIQIQLHSLTALVPVVTVRLTQPVTTYVKLCHVIYGYGC